MKSLMLLASSLVFGKSIAFQLSTDQQPLLDVGDCDCNCTGAIPTVGRERFYVCENSKLGPVYLPFRMPLLSFVSDYDRFGGLTPGAFLERWINKTTGNYTWPKNQGFQLDISGKPINASMILEVGTKVDRFGGEGGQFISAADAPFAQRSLPPSSLNVQIDPKNPREPFDHPWSYHVYTVTKRLEVVGGPIAPWFGQPGLGAQFFVGKDRNISSLIKDGYLKPEKIGGIIAGPGIGNKCTKRPGKFSAST